MFRKFFIYMIIVFAILQLALVSYAYSGARSTSEYKVKAVIIYKLLKYITRPDLSDGPGKQALTIGVMGNKTMLNELATIKDQIKSYQVQVRKIKFIKSDQIPDILFVSNSEANSYQEIFTALNSRNTLIIGEGGDFCQLGGMICFDIIDDQVKFEINVMKLRSVGMDISSIALRAASKVWTKENLNR